jgi:hypothetical protein
MEKITILLFCSLAVTSCNSNRIDSKEKIEKTVSVGDDKQPLGLYIITSTTVGKETSYDSTRVNSDYFEVGLGEVEGKGYRAEKTLQNSRPGEKFRYVFFLITDKNGHIPYFNSSTDFLNYMSKRGYEMADQIKNKYGADYTFKKKLIH